MVAGVAPETMEAAAGGGARWGCGTERGGGGEEVREHRELTRELEEGSARPEERTGRRNRPGGGAADARSRGRIRCLQATPAQSHPPGGRGGGGEAEGAVGWSRGGRSRRRDASNGGGGQELGREN